MNTPNTISLHPFTETDAEALFHLVDTNRDQLKKFWWENGTTSSQDSLRFIEAALSDERYSRRPTRGIWKGDRLIGVGSVHSVDWDLGKAALGYWIDRSEWGKGYATETARQLCQLAFEQMGLQVLTISCRVENYASRAVAEKIGFELLEVDTHQAWRGTLDGGAEVAHYRLVKAA